MSFWANKNVLVTGAGGFIGSNLVEALAREGASVTAFLHYNARADMGMLRYSDPELRRNIKPYFGELRDPQAMRQAMHGAQTVFHLAALIGIPYSYVHPYDVVQTNMVGTLNVLSTGATSMSSGWYTPPRVRSMVRPCMHPSTRNTRSKDSRRIRPARSGLTNWQRAFTSRTVCRSAPCARSIPTGHASPRGGHSHHHLADADTGSHPPRFPVTAP